MNIRMPLSEAWENREMKAGRVCFAARLGN